MPTGTACFRVAAPVLLAGLLAGVPAAAQTAPGTARVRLLHNVSFAPVPIRAVLATDTDNNGTYETTNADVTVNYTASPSSGEPFIRDVPAGVPARVTITVSTPFGPLTQGVVLPASTLAAGKSYTVQMAEDGQNAPVVPQKVCALVPVVNRRACLGYAEVPPFPSGKTGALAVVLGVWNGVPDAGPLDFRFAGSPTPIAENVNSGDPGTYVTVEEGAYRIEVTRRSTGVKLGTFTVDLTGQGGQVADVLAKGYLDPAANPSQLGTAQPFGLTEANQSGGSTPTGAPRAETAGAALALGAAYPNPTAGPAALRLTLGAPAVVSAEVFDALGRRVAAVAARPVAAGSTDALALDAAGLPAGAYVVRVTATGAAGTQTRTAPLTVAR